MLELSKARHAKLVALSAGQALYLGPREAPLLAGTINAYRVAVHLDGDRFGVIDVDAHSSRYGLVLPAEFHIDLASTSAFHLAHELEAPTGAILIHEAGRALLGRSRTGSPVWMVIDGNDPDDNAKGVIAVRWNLVALEESETFRSIASLGSE